ncbi:4'-phosphopantetheinyl transferase superfamily [Butyriboletus roseoflavus]|nr:4'-phosphopantetheinyl transferase superfamily [Butyriboletus roseoflavus]
MQVWTIIYDKTNFPDSLYHSALPLVDQPARSKITRFHRREDACRSLIGSLLPRVLLRKRGIPRDAIVFAVTDTGKPYAITPGLDPPLGFNVTHDEGVVAMAFGTGDLGPPAYNIGVDIMQLKVPPRITFPEFVDTVSSQLTPLERATMLADVPEPEAIRRFYWVWTLKEAYTKALGIGLGFDFRRIQYDVVQENITIDGEPARGWQFRKFEVTHSGNKYVGVAARFVGGRHLNLAELDEGSLVCYDAASFVHRAIEELA